MVAAVETVKLIGGTAIVLYARDGQQIVNTGLQSDEAPPKRLEFDTERRAIETGQPQAVARRTLAPFAGPDRVRPGFDAFWNFIWTRNNLAQWRQPRQVERCGRPFHGHLRRNFPLRCPLI
jgi:hypothetical protein